MLTSHFDVVEQKRRGDLGWHVDLRDSERLAELAVVILAPAEELVGVVDPAGEAASGGQVDPLVRPADGRGSVFTRHRSQACVARAPIAELPVLVVAPTPTVAVLTL